MWTKHASIDPLERDLAAAELNDIAQANEGKPWAVWKDAVVQWHIEAIADARANAWIPGMASSHAPMVNEVLKRFYGYHMKSTIGRLKFENMGLRRSLVAAVACARFYSSGANDAGVRAHTILAALESERLPARSSRLD